MVSINRPLQGYRIVEIQQDDTLQQIAARELGDASRWADIVSINGLSPPYLTGDLSLAGPAVKLYGQTLIVPAPTVQVPSVIDPDAAFGVDLDLTNGVLSAESGDFALISGRDNLKQALLNRVDTDPGELLFHLNYGCKARRLLGAMNGPTTGQLAAAYVKTAVLMDSRVASVSSSTATVEGDSIAVDAEVQPVTGSSIDLSTQV